MDIHAIDTVSTTQRPFDSTTLHTFSIREPGSAITHGIAMVFALIGAIPLMPRRHRRHGYLDRSFHLLREHDPFVWRKHCVSYF